MGAAAAAMVQAILTKNRGMIEYDNMVLHPLPSRNYGDGQTNLIKFIPFICPSRVHASPPTDNAGIRYH